MQQSFDVMFASSNKNKFEEAKKILESFGINLVFFKCELEEIQSDSITEIASKKVQNAYKLCKKPVIIEDDGLFINSLKGFPGPFSSYVFKTIGNDGIIQLVKKNRKANFQSIIAFCEKNHQPVLFSAKIEGSISKKSKGKGWGYDPIFVPSGKTKTFAELDKNIISHRYKALKKFSSWYFDKKKSNDR